MSVQRPGVPLGAVVAIACAVQFMVVLDGTIVTVALPNMGRQLGGALGLAVVVTAAAARGYQTALLVAAGIGAATVLLLLGAHRHPPIEPGE